MNFTEFKRNFQKIEVKEFENSVPENITVSVCVQAYNQVSFIEDCLNSILAQKTDFSYEILLGDDGSTDGTRKICISYAEKYPDKIRLFLHHRENNIKIDGKSTGLFNSFYNLFAAKGKYIAYCDGDDFWTDEFKLGKQIDFLEKNKAYSICYHDIITIDENGNRIFIDYLDQIRADFKPDDLKKVLVQPPISTWCFRNVIRETPIEMTQTINADNFWISLLGFYGGGKFIKNIKPSCYRIHSKGIWSLINRNTQLNSKKKTYEILSRYYSHQGNLYLSKYFHDRALKFYKMLLLSNLKSLQLKFIIFNTPKFLKANFKKLKF